MYVKLRPDEWRNLVLFGHAAASNLEARGELDDDALTTLTRFVQTLDDISSQVDEASGRSFSEEVKLHAAANKTEEWREDQWYKALPKLKEGDLVIRNFAVENGVARPTDVGFSRSRSGSGYVIKARYDQRMECWKAFPSGAGLACFYDEPNIPDNWVAFRVTEVHYTGKHACVEVVDGDWGMLETVYKAFFQGTGTKVIVGGSRDSVRQGHQKSG